MPLYLPLESRSQLNWNSCRIWAKN